MRLEAIIAGVVVVTSQLCLAECIVPTSIITVLQKVVQSEKLAENPGNTNQLALAVATMDDRFFFRVRNNADPWLMFVFASKTPTNPQGFFCQRNTGLAECAAKYTSLSNDKGVRVDDIQTCENSVIISKETVSPNSMRKRQLVMQCWRM